MRHLSCVLRVRCSLQRFIRSEWPLAEIDAHQARFELDSSEISSLNGGWIPCNFPLSVSLLPGTPKLGYFDRVWMAELKNEI